jgi:hypothetical protein
MHDSNTRPAPCPRTTSDRTNTAAAPSASPSEVRREATIAYQRLANELPAGLHRALRQMLDSLVAAADGRPIGMFSDLIVEVTASCVLVGPSSDDPVVYGVQRRFAVRATQTCHRCGRNGRARKDLGGRVRCARCAAPALLLNGIDQVLNQASSTRDVDNSATEAALPPLLRPMFRTHIEQHLLLDQGEAKEMNCQLLRSWRTLLRDLRSELRIRHIAAL